MGKFYAMLRDSFKEAVDGWIFLMMLVLSGILILLVVSLSVEPLPSAVAVPKMLGNRGGQNPLSMVHPDRGQGKRLIMFMYFINASDVETIKAGAHPWDDEVRFTLQFNTVPFGPAGVEVDDPKAPKQAKQVEGGLFSDAFKEAVRTWASTTGEKEKPKYTDELAKEFVAAQLKDVTRLNVTKVEKQSGSTFTVTAAGTTTPLAWTHRPSLFFGLWTMSFLDTPLGQLIELVEDTLVNGIGAWVVLLAGVIVTAGFIPNMLRKGAIDLLLTKPMSRPLILIFKYLGGMLFVFLLTTFTVGGVWAAIGLRTGVWAPGLLYSIFGVTFYFAILYSCSTLFGVLTRNAIVSIVVTIVFWFVVWLIGTIHNTVTVLDNLEVQRERPASAKKTDEKTDDGKGEKGKGNEGGDNSATERDEMAAPRVPKALVQTFDILNAVTPRTKDLDTLTTKLISQDLLSPAEQRQAGLKLRDLNWGEVLGVAGAYIALFLGLAMLRFVTRSY
jgi:ABC-type transport system involved in multi-copper enzyme maturation permease subunit